MRSFGVWAGIYVFLVLVAPSPPPPRKGFKRLLLFLFRNLCKSHYHSIHMIDWKKIFFKILDYINWAIFICLANWYSTIHISFLCCYVLWPEKSNKIKKSRNKSLVRYCMWYYIAVKAPRPSSWILRKTVILGSRGEKKIGMCQLLVN